MQGYRRWLGAFSISFLAACTSLAHSKGGDDPQTDDAAIAGDDDASAHQPAAGQDLKPLKDGGRGDAGRTGGAPTDAGHPQSDGGVAPDGGKSCEQLAFYADFDGDDYGDPATAINACEAPAGYVSDRSDCNDDCKSCHPGGEETCDERDNNCDDTTDEGCTCEPGTTRPCGEDRGVCEPGTQACDDGLWGNDCAGARGPDPSELCNGLDDDCNGSPDDAFPDLGSACTSGVGQCAHAGVYVCASDAHAAPVCSATPGNAVTEVCDNDLDDDCDSRSDEAPSATTCCVDAHCGANQKCSAGSCADKTGCELRSRANDVLAADYQCLDFDRTASFSPWTAATTTGGGIAISTAQATSAPKSVYATLSGNTGSEGRLRWNATGAKAIKSVSLSASVHFPTVIGFHELWMGHDEVLCIRYNSSSYCVNYAYSEDSLSGWGLALEEEQTTGSVETHVCQLQPAPSENVWSRIELRVSSTGAPAVYLNGTALSSPGCTFSLLTSTAVTLEVGLKQTADDEAWQLYFDDVEASIKR